MPSTTGIMTSLAAAALLCAGSAQASSPEAWSQLQASVFKACTAQSGLTSARVTAYWPYFEAHAIARVRGYPSGQGGKGGRDEVLCLYNKRTGAVELSRDRRLP